jgi:hypothetical protein
LTLPQPRQALPPLPTTSPPTTTLQSPCRTRLGSSSSGTRQFLRLNAWRSISPAGAAISALPCNRTCYRLATCSRPRR